jgi:acyl-CoA synthetase (AMP-forming)/AMP-acid ligase II
LDNLKIAHQTLQKHFFVFARRRNIDRDEFTDQLLDLYIHGLGRSSGVNLKEPGRLPPEISHRLLLPSKFPSQSMNQPVFPATLFDLLHNAPGGGGALIIPETGARISCDSLRRQVSAAAGALAALGIQPGQRIAIALGNGPAAIVSFLAASFAGTAAPLNPAYRYDEFCFYLEDTNARLLIVPPDGAEEARHAARGRGIPVVTAETNISGEVNFRGTPPAAQMRTPAPDDIALVLHTSGSTGRPKRVPLRHINLALSAQNIVNTYRLSSGDVSLCLMPLFHVHGLVASALSTLLSGGAVIVPERFNPLSFWRAVRDYRATWYSAVPTIHQLILARSGSGAKPAGAESLRFVRSCSAPLPVETAEKLESLMGVPVLEAYGMTEASHQMASNPLPPQTRKFGTVGMATGIQIGIMTDTGELLSPGGKGEVVLKGPSVIQAYENNPEANAKSFTNGWFRTGDEGVLDDDGYLRLTGRIKELINRGGEKIAPREIDEVLLAHPAVAEAVCFGIPHPTWGEEVAAAVVLRKPATEAELLAYCREHLAEFKRPKKLFLVESIPRTATGKVQRLNVAAELAGVRG